MIFHRRDTSWKRIASCWKRANALAKPLPWYYEMFVDVSKHPLHIQFENLMLATPDDELPDLGLLDWFAMKVDDYAKQHMLINDRIARDALWRWKELMFLDPTKMVNNSAIVVCKDNSSDWFSEQLEDTQKKGA